MPLVFPKSQAEGFGSFSAPKLEDQQRASLPGLLRRRRFRVTVDNPLQRRARGLEIPRLMKLQVGEQVQPARHLALGGLGLGQEPFQFLPRQAELIEFLGVNAGKSFTRLVVVRVLFELAEQRAAWAAASSGGGGLNGSVRRPTRAGYSPSRIRWGCARSANVSLEAIWVRRWLAR